jgi:hypothetical protein
MKKNIFVFAFIICFLAITLSGCGLFKKKDNNTYNNLAIEELRITHTLNNNTLTVNVEPLFPYYIIKDISLGIGCYDNNNFVGNEYAISELPVSVSWDIRNVEYSIIGSASKFTVKGFQVKIYKGKIAVAEWKHDPNLNVEKIKNTDI